MTIVKFYDISYYRAHENTNAMEGSIGKKRKGERYSCVMCTLSR